MDAIPASERFMDCLRQALAEGQLVKASFSGYGGTEAGLRRVHLRPVVIKAGMRLQAVYRYATRDVTRNITLEEAPPLLESFLRDGFQNAHLLATDVSATLERHAGRRDSLRVLPVREATRPSCAHDRRKQRPIDAQRAGWLCGLGVTDAQGAVRKQMQGKFRQINKFVEILRSLLDAAAVVPEADGGPPGVADAPRALRLVDMGCGKGYLTFAAYDWLRGHGWPHLEALGVEVRAELVELTNRVAEQHGLAGLHFRQGAIADMDAGRADILMALHACDTATDDAIARGVQSGAALILVAPCCHKELRPALRPPPALTAALQHGILRERQAEFVTDALRAGLLEWAGYEARVFEFVATEHTAKNLMIAAIKRRQPCDAGAAARRVRALAACYGIERQALAARLRFDLLKPDDDDYPSLTGCGGLQQAGAGKRDAGENSPDPTGKSAKWPVFPPKKSDGCPTRTRT